MGFNSAFKGLILGVYFIPSWVRNMTEYLSSISAYRLVPFTPGKNIKPDSWSCFRRDSDIFLKCHGKYPTFFFKYYLLFGMSQPWQMKVTVLFVYDAVKSGENIFDLQRNLLSPTSECFSRSVETSIFISENTVFTIQLYWICHMIWCWFIHTIWLVDQRSILVWTYRPLLVLWWHCAMRNTCLTL